MRGQGTPLNCLLALDFIDSAFICHSLLKGQGPRSTDGKEGYIKDPRNWTECLTWGHLVNTFYYKPKGCFPTANGNCSQVLP